MEYGLTKKVQHGQHSIRKFVDRCEILTLKLPELSKRPGFQSLTRSGTSPVACTSIIFWSLNDMHILFFSSGDVTTANRYRSAVFRNQLFREYLFVRQKASSAKAHTPYSDQRFPTGWDCECKSSPWLHKIVPADDHRTELQRPHRFGGCIQ